LDKRTNIFEDIRTELGLYSSNREFLIFSRREIAKIAKTPEIFGVCISTEC